MVGDGGDEWFGRAWKEFGKGECLGSIAAERIRGLGGIEVGENGLVEAQVRPAREEAEDSEEEGSDGQKRGEREYQHQAKIEERESRDAQREDASEECDGVRWDKLAECDEEADLQGNRAGNTCETRQQ